MRQRRKEALIISAISIPMLAYGALTFEIGGAASTAEAVIKATVTTLGLFGTVGGLLMFFTKNSLGLVESKEPKQKKKEKKMAKRKATKKTGSESIDLMQKEKELEKQSEELTESLNETAKTIKAVKAELSEVRDNLRTKGWVLSNKGWVIE